MLSGGVKRPGKPLDVRAVDGHHVKSARRRRRESLQVMLRRMQQPPLLGRSHTGGGAAMRAACASADFNENQGAFMVAHHQVDLAAARRRPAGHPIIAFDQNQLVLQQVAQGKCLGGVAPGPGAG